MGFFIRLLKEINSAGNEKYISLAVALGLLGGFLPFFNIFSFIILFLVLILRVPIGLFIASTGVFSLTAYIFDPLLNKIGYEILTSKITQSFFGFLYNLPLMRYSGFNNTMVMGSMVTGIFLSVLLFIVLNKTIIHYRENVFGFMLKYKFLRWIVPAESEKKGVIRTAGIIVVAFVVVLSILFFIFVFDPLLKTVLEYSLSKITHKQVKITKVTTSFSEGSININGLSVNRVKIKKIDLKLSKYYLLWKKLDIKYLNIENIHYGKNIEKILSQKNTGILKKSEKYRFEIKLPKPEDLINTYRLKSIDKISKLQKDYENYVIFIDKSKKNLKMQKKEIERIKTEIHQLNDQVKHIKNLKDIKKIIHTSEKLKKQINSIKTDIKKNKKTLTDMKKELLNDIGAVKTASMEDYKFLSEKYSLLKNGRYYKFAQTFLKPEINTYIKRILQVYSLVKPYLKRSTKQTYIRKKGIYIKYKDKIHFPDFVLEKGKLTFSFKNADGKAEIYNISSDQNLLDKKGLLTGTIHSGYFKKFVFNVSYFDNVNIDTVIEGLKIKLLKIDTLTMKNVYLNAKLNGEVKKSEMHFVIYSKIYPRKIIFKNSKTLSLALSKIKNFDIKAVISGRIDSYSIKINSDLDKKLSKILKKEINLKIEKNKIKLKRLLNKKINTQIKNTGFDKKILKNDLGTKWKKYSENLDNLKNQLKKYTLNRLKREILKKGIKDFIKF